MTNDSFDTPLNSPVLSLKDLTGTVHEIFLLNQLLFKVMIWVVVVNIMLLYMTTAQDYQRWILPLI